MHLRECDCWKSLNNRREANRELPLLETNQDRTGRDVESEQVRRVTLIRAAWGEIYHRPEGLLWALRYERASVYEDLGQRRRALSEFEKLYTEAPDYEDVAARLGL